MIFKRTYVWGFWVSGIVLYSCANKSNSNQFVQIPLKTTTEKVTVATAEALASQLSNAELTARVGQILESQCYSCHGQNGSNGGNVGDIRNTNTLAEKGYIKLGVPAEQSKLYQRLISKTQPMPPLPLKPLSDNDIMTVKAFIERKQEKRSLVSYASVYEAIENDFSKFSPSERVNIRYFHLVNKYNSGAPDASLDQTRKALSKMLNMLSTSDKIIKPVAVDTLNLVYRVNLADYELHRPETMYTFMLKTIFPKLSANEIEKWLPDPAEREVKNYYGARYKEIFEGKKSEANFIDPALHTFEQGLPLPNNAILKRMALQMTEAAQKSDEISLKNFGAVSALELSDSQKCRSGTPTPGIQCSYPTPLMRADWFVSQVAGNMRMRLYYHGSGMDDDTVTLDAALGIDDVEGSIYDNDINFDRSTIPQEQRIIRAGFNNSGVSINHRSFERIALNYVPGKPLWRAFEFKDKALSKYSKHDIFKYAAGPIFEIGNEDEPGFECVNFMTDRYTSIPGSGLVRTLSLLDHGMLYPSKMPLGGDPKIVKELRATAPGSDTHKKLLDEFKTLFGHTDFQTWQSDAYIAKYGNLPLKEDGPYAGKRMLKCELDQSNPVAYRHETLEYLFLKRNGLQAFVNVGLKAEHLDYKIPNQRALENKEALLIPAHDNKDLMVVGAPLSCLSCHTQGFIEKEDQVAKYMNASVKPSEVSETLWNRIKAKINAFHVPFEELKQQMAKDNEIFRSSLQSAGVNYKDPEPIVDTYREWAIPGLTIARVAEELEISQKDLENQILFDGECANILREFKIPGATIRRSEFERNYRTLMCRIHGSCKTIDEKNIIPTQ